MNQNNPQAPALPIDDRAQLMALPASQVCTPGLWRLLTGSDDWHGAVRQISINATLKAEVARISPILEAKCEPLDRTGIIAKMVQNSPPFGIPDRSPEEWAALYDAYVEALTGLSAEMLDDAFKRWNRGEMYPKEKGRHAFFPRPAELYAMAEKSKIELVGARYRARRALEHIEKAPPPQPTQEERGKRRQELIDAGILDAEGHVVLGTPSAAPERRAGPRETPQQMAERLRELSDDGGKLEGEEPEPL